MAEANRFFARKKLGENINEEVGGWDVNRDYIHKRYKLLQRILSDIIDDETLNLAKELLIPESTGKPNMSIHEFRKWPILESFRKSEYWDDFEAHARRL